MKTFIADIFSRLKNYSQKLDNLTLLTNQHWVVLSELQNSKTVYIFRTNGELLIAVNGDVQKAKWEYLGPNALLIDLPDKSYLFRHGFFDENILALKIDSKEEYAVFVNETRFKTELNSIEAVSAFLDQHYLTAVINTTATTGSPTSIHNIIYIKDDFSLKMGAFTEFLVVFTNGRRLPMYRKLLSGKYFIYRNAELVFFPDEQTCLAYLLNQAR